MCWLCFTAACWQQACRLLLLLAPPAMPGTLPGRPPLLTCLRIALPRLPRREDLQQYTGPWPQRMFLAMGSREYSGIRQEPGPQWDQLLVSYCTELAGLLESRGLDASRLKWQVSLFILTHFLSASGS